MLRRLFGPFFIFAGLMHFIRPRWYEAIMPPWLPAHTELVYVSGVAEIAGGALISHPRTRRAGMLLSVATLVAVYPANVYMALNPDEFDVPGGAASLYARLPVQLLFIAWAIAAGHQEED